MLERAVYVLYYKASLEEKGLLTAGNQLTTFSFHNLFSLSIRGCYYISSQVCVGGIKL